MAGLNQPTGAIHSDWIDPAHRGAIHGDWAGLNHCEVDQTALAGSVRLSGLIQRYWIELVRGESIQHSWISLAEWTDPAVLD